MKLFVPALFAFSDAYKYKEIHDIYYNGDQTLPAGDERGIQWHQCGQNTLALPEEGRDFMCSGNECWLVCNRGHVPQKSRRAKCVQKEDGFGWDRKLNKCITCDGDLAAETSKGNIQVPGGFGQCDTYGIFNLERCTFKCGQSNKEIGKVKNGNFTHKSKRKTYKCKCAWDRDARERSCGWTLWKKAVPNILATVDELTCKP